MIKRLVVLLFILLGIFLILIATPLFLIVPSGQQLHINNYLLAVFAIIIGASSLIAAKKLHDSIQIK